MSNRKIDDWITRYLEYTDNSEPPTIYKEWVAISVIASALQRKCYLNWGDIVFYPNMYVVLVGPSGKCRKGTAMNVGASFLRKLGIKTAAEAVTREALIRELANASVTTIEEATGDAYFHASLTIFAQELTVFLGYNNLQLIADLTDWYDCRNTWTYRTKNMGTDEIIGVWVNLIGATTPELIQTALPKDAIGGGLASRVVFVYADRKSKLVATPFISDGQRVLYDELVGDLERINMLAGQFKVTGEFITKYSAWYHKQEDNPPFDDDRFAGYFERRPNHIMKLCMILTASEGNSMTITAKVFDRAVDLLTRTEKTMPKTFTGYGTSPVADVMTRIMTNIATSKTVTRTQLMQRFYADLESDRQLDSIIQSLQSMDFCHVIVGQYDSTVQYRDTYGK